MSGDLQRKLTTILAADAEGYSQAMGRDEVGTIADLRAARGVFARFIERHHGRIANTAGDGLIAEFPSVVEAVQCAIEVQNELNGASATAKLKFRIGVHLGDVIVDGDDLLGDGVNLAARLQNMAEPGGVLISQQVYDQVHAKLTVGFEYLGERRPKNLAEDVPVYRITMQGKTASVWPSFRVDRSESSAPPSGTSPMMRILANLPDEAQSTARRFAVISGVILLVNAVSGGGFWAHWPILVLAIVFGWKYAPQLAPPGLSDRMARAVVLCAGLFLVNVFSWGGVIWSAIPIAVVGLMVYLSLSRSKDGQVEPLDPDA